MSIGAPESRNEPLGTARCYLERRLSFHRPAKATSIESKVSAEHLPGFHTREQPKTLICLGATKALDRPAFSDVSSPQHPYRRVIRKTTTERQRS